MPTEVRLAECMDWDGINDPNRTWKFKWMGDEFEFPSYEEATAALKLLWAAARDECR